MRCEVKLLNGSTKFDETFRDHHLCLWNHVSPSMICLETQVSRNMSFLFVVCLLEVEVLECAVSSHNVFKSGPRIFVSCAQVNGNCEILRNPSTLTPLVSPRNKRRKSRRVALTYIIVTYLCMRNENLGPGSRVSF